MTFPVDRPTENLVSDLTITVLDRTKPEAIIGSESDELPVVEDWEVIVFAGRIGTINKGIWVVRDDNPSTSEFKAFKLGSLPVTDLDISAGAKVNCGGMLYLHAGERVAADAAVEDVNDVVFLELKATVLTREDPPEEDIALESVPQDPPVVP